MSNKQKLILLFLIFSNSYVFSQEIKNVDFEVRENNVIINFDLMDCPAHEKYDVSLKFVDENNKTIRPRTIHGDLTNLTCGRKKEIIWDVLKDQEELSGKLNAVVEISKRHKTKIEGGPCCAFYSLLVPGLGDNFINIDKSTGKYAIGTSDPLIKPIYITAATYCLLGYGVYNKIQSNKSYDLYHKATLQADMDSYYEKANKQNHDFILYTGLGLTVWICDIIYVAYKGFENKKEQLSYSNHSPKFFFTSNYKGLQLNYTIQF